MPRGGVIFRKKSFEIFQNFKIFDKKITKLPIIQSAKQNYNFLYNLGIFAFFSKNFNFNSILFDQLLCGKIFKTFDFKIFLD
jgi:hypothetical protein